MSQKNKNQCYSAKVVKDCATGCVIRTMLWPLMNVFDTCLLFSGLHESQPPSADCLSALSGFTGQWWSLEDVKVLENPFLSLPYSFTWLMFQPQTLLFRLEMSHQDPVLWTRRAPR